MSSNFDESQLTDAPAGFDESQLTDAPPEPPPDLPYGAIGDALDITAKMLDVWRGSIPQTYATAGRRLEGSMGEEKIGQTQGPESELTTSLLRHLPKGEGAAYSEAKRQPAGTNLPAMPKTEQIVTGVTEGLVNTAEGVIEFGTSPAGLALMGLSGGAGALKPLAEALVKGAFAVDIGSQAPALHARMVEAAEHYGATGDPGPLSQAVTEATAAGFFVGQMGKGAVKGVREQMKGKPVAAIPTETLGAEGPPIVAGERDRVTFTKVVTPEERAAELVQQASFREEMQRQAETRAKQAEQYIRTNLGGTEEIPAPATPEQLTRFMPTEEEVAEVRRKSAFRDGAVNVDELPDSLAVKIGAERKVDELLEAMVQVRQAGGVGKWQDLNAADNATLESPWRSISSPLPKELQQNFSWDDIFRIVDRGRAGEPLTPRQMRFYEDVVAWASRGITKTKLDPYITQEYLDRYGFDVVTTPIKEQVAAEAMTALERAAVEAEAKGATGDLSAADLEFRAGTGTSDVETVGVKGEAIRPLNPPELDLQGALDSVLTRATRGDPQASADLLTALYGVPDKVLVRVDPKATVARTEELPVVTIDQAATGQPITMKLYRGEGAAATPLTRGIGVPLLGPGRYSTSDPMYAKEYGQVRNVLVDLKNPLVIRTDQDWRALTQKSGWEFPNVAGTDPAMIPEMTARMRSVVEQMGHDGMVIDFDPLNELQAKVLGRMFDSATVIEFQPQEVPRFTITLPPDASPWQVAHEVAYEVRKFAGKLTEDLPHDDNIIAARVLSDLRARGFMDQHPNGLPRTGFVGGAPNPLGMAQGRTFELDRPFPDSTTRQADVPALKNVFDPTGVLDPDNAVRHGAIFRQMVTEGAKVLEHLGKAGFAETDELMRAFHAGFLRDRGFDGHIWKDEMGRHLTEIPRTPEYVPGTAEATEIGEPKAGAPEEARILSDFEFVKTAVERGGGTDLQAQIPLLSPFVEHTAVPFAKNVYEAVKETAVGLGRALQPRLFVEGRYLDEVSRALGTKNRALSEFRVSVAVRKMRSMLDKLTRQEQIEFIDNVKLGRPQKTPELQVVDDLIGKLEDGWYTMLQDEMQQHGKSLPYLENHLALIYDRKNAAAAMPNALNAVQAQVASHRPLEGSKSFMRKMIYESLSEAMANGMKPVSTNPFVLMELRLQDNMKFLSARKMFRTLKDQGAVRFVPLGTERKFLQAQKGWQVLDDRISRVYFPTDAGQVHAGNYFWEPATHRIISNYLSRDLIRETKVGRGLVALKNYGTAVELGLSPFHFYFVNGDAMATGTSLGFRKLASGNITGGLGDVLKSVAGSMGPGHFGLFGAPRDYVREGGSVVRYIGNKDEFLKTARGADFVKRHPNIDAEIDAIFEGGLLLKQSEDYRLKSIQALKDSYNNGDYAGMMIRAFPAAVQAPVEHLFETYIPQMKLGAFLADYGQSLIEHQDGLAKGTISRTALARAAVDRVEDRFGEMNFDNLFWNRTMKTALQLLMRSVTWNLGDIRAVSRSAAHGVPAQAREFNAAVFEPILKAYKQGGLGGAARAPIRAPKLDADLTWLAGVVVHTAISSTIAQGIFTAINSPDHKPLMPWESDTPLVDIAMPRTGLLDRSGRPLRLSIASYLREWVSYWKRPKQFIGHKLSATFARALETWQNKDFYGNWVYDPQAPAWERFVDIMGHQITTPISVQTMGSAERNYGMPGAQAKALPFFGLGISSPSYFATPFEEYMQNVLHAEFARRPGRSPEQAERAELSRDVVKAMREGKEIPEEALAIGSERLKRAAREGLNSGFEARVNRLSLKQLLDGWEFADAQERAKLQPVLMRKVQNARLAGKSEAEVNEIISQVEAIQAQGGQ